MARRTFNSQRGNRGARPNRGWSTFGLDAFVTVAAASTVLVGGLTPSSTGIDLTILRTVGEMAVVSDQSAGAEQQIGAWGIIPVSDEAFAAGVASVPSPDVDGGHDGWFVFQYFGYLSDDGTEARRQVFDSKAKRIIAGDGVTMAIVVANFHATHGFSFLVNLRMLSQIRGTR